jgi:hypothetical protein
MFVEANVSPNQLWPVSDHKIEIYSYYGADIRGLSIALSKWARHWHLEAEWCLDDACWTLDMWQRFPEEKRTTWLSSGSGWMRLNDSAFAHLTPPDGLSACNADYEFRLSYVQRAESKIREHIEQSPFLSNLKAKLKTDVIDYFMTKVNAYCDEVLKVYDRQVDADGNPTWKRADSKKDLLRNIEWAVKFQVRELTFSEIAKADGVAASTVKREVDRTLALIGLKRRDTWRGRPVGKQDARPGAARVIKRLGR